MVILPLLLLSITVTSMLPSTATLTDPSHAEHSPNPRFRSGPCLRPPIYTTGQTDFNESFPFTSTSTYIISHCTMVSQGCHVESSPIRNIHTPGFLHLNPSSLSPSASSPPHSTSSLTESTIPSMTSLRLVSPDSRLRPSASRTSPATSLVRHHMEFASPVGEAPEAGALGRPLHPSAMDTREGLEASFFVVEGLLFPNW
jgi:hypothetical protein